MFNFAAKHIPYFIFTMKKRVLLLTSLGATAVMPFFAQDMNRPNVILLVADDLGYGDLSCYGATRVSTPRIDSIANQGIRFTDCHAAASTSTPSRYSLLTGEYCFRRSDSGIAQGDAKMIIRPDQYTIADMFKSAGYGTAAIGKWHLGLGSEAGKQTWNTKLDVGVNDLGFDYSYIMAATADRVPCVFIEDGSIANFDSSAPIQVSYTSNFAGEPTGVDNPELLTKLKSSHGHNNSIVNGIGRIGYMKGGGKALWRDEDIADSIMAHAIEFIEGHKDEPFFMYLGTNDVHVPRYPHERFRGKSVMGLRGEAILQFDYSVGLLVDALQRLGISDNTLLIITSDNGPVLDDGYQDKAVALAGSHKAAGKFRGGKYGSLEAGTTVPFIVNWPAHIEGGKTNDALISHIDLIASLGSLVGAEIPLAKAIDSHDHMSTLLGHDSVSRDYVLCMAQNRSLTLRMDKWKYIEPSNGPETVAGPGIETGYRTTPQLYNLQNDIHEDKNLYNTETAKAQEMESLLAEIRRPFVSGDTTFWYNLYTPNREDRYTKASGVAGEMKGVLNPNIKSTHWKFVRRPDGTYDIINRLYGCYVAPATPTHNPSTALLTQKEQPSQGWTITTNGMMSSLYAIVSNTAQFNQTVKDRGYLILNWGDGTNTSDPGCQYAANLYEIELPEGETAIRSIEKPSNARLTVKNGHFNLEGHIGIPQVYDLTGKQLRPSNAPVSTPVVVRLGQQSFVTVLR